MIISENCQTGDHVTTPDDGNRDEQKRAHFSAAVFLRSPLAARSDTNKTKRAVSNETKNIQAGESTHIDRQVDRKHTFFEILLQLLDGFAQFDKMLITKQDISVNIHVT